MVLSFFPPSPQRTFLTIVVHGSSGYFLRFSIFVSLFWADSLFCFLDIVPTEVLFWQLLFILPVNTAVFFVLCPNKNLIPFRHRENVSLPSVFSLCVRFVCEQDTDNSPYLSDTTTFFSGICFDNFSCEPVSKNI